MDNVNLTTVIIARNEAKRIAACIGNLGFSDEVIVIDNGSTDGTAETATAKGATVIHSDASDFSKLRNLGLAHARGRWILYVDADETVTPGLAREIRRVVSAKIRSGDPTAYRLPRHNRFLGHPFPHTDRLERLFVRKHLKGWYGPVHESPDVDGPVGDLSVPLEHDTHRTLEEMVEKTNEWSSQEARLRLAARHPPVTWWRIFRVMITGFGNSYVKQGGWRAGVTGLIEGIYQSFSMFVTYAKLWEMQMRSQTRNDHY